MKTPSLDGIKAFLSVAEHKSFSAAALHLGVTPTAISKAVRAIEREHKVLLFQRTTRSVSLTETGTGLRARLLSATSEIDDAFAALNTDRDQPVGTLRLTVPRNLGAFVIKSLIPLFHRAYPAIRLDISLDDRAIDLVVSGYDAGIRLGQSVEKDMVALRLTPDLSWSVVGSPAYLKKNGRPSIPEDLINHETIRYRFITSNALHRWEFVHRAQRFYVEAGQGIVVNDTAMIAEFARQGIGLAYLPDIEIDHSLQDGHLERLLTSFVPKTSGLYLYFPSGTQKQPKLRAFIDVVRGSSRLPG
jgi:DNA-binding transcriptional LysR family regulator